MAISAIAALCFLPFVLPICFYVAFTDMREMRITNQAVVALAVVFLIVGLIALPLPVYGMRLLQLFGVLIVGILLNAGGAIGAGDAKFAAAAAPLGAEAGHATTDAAAEAVPPGRAPPRKAPSATTFAMSRNCPVVRPTSPRNRSSPSRLSSIAIGTRSSIDASTASAIARSNPARVGRSVAANQGAAPIA